MSQHSVLERELSSTPGFVTAKPQLKALSPFGPTSFCGSTLHRRSSRSKHRIAENQFILIIMYGSECGFDPPEQHDVVSEPRIGNGSDDLPHRFILVNAVFGSRIVNMGLNVTIEGICNRTTSNSDPLELCGSRSTAVFLHLRTDRDERFCDDDGIHLFLSQRNDVHRLRERAKKGSSLVREKQ